MLKIKADRFEDEGFGDVELGETYLQQEQDLKDSQNYLAGVHMLNKLGFTNWGGIVKKLHDAYQGKGAYPETLDAFAKHHPSVKVLEEEFAKKDSPFNSPMFDKEHNISKETHKQAREFMNPQVEKFEEKVAEKSKSDPTLLRDMKTIKEAYIDRPSRHLNEDKQQKMDLAQPKIDNELSDEDKKALEELDNIEEPKTKNHDSEENSWWDLLTPEQKAEYKKEHPNTKMR